MATYNFQYFSNVNFIAYLEKAQPERGQQYTCLLLRQYFSFATTETGRYNETSIIFGIKIKTELIHVFCTSIWRDSLCIDKIDPCTSAGIPRNVIFLKNMFASIILVTFALYYCIHGIMHGLYGINSVGSENHILKYSWAGAGSSFSIESRLLHIKLNIYESTQFLMLIPNTVIFSETWSILGPKKKWTNTDKICGLERIWP